MLNTQEPKIVNGVNVTALFETIEAIKADDSIADFKFQAKNKWLGGALNRSTINEFYGAKETRDRAEPFVFDNDEPPVLLGDDSGANPVEFLLHGLAGCLTTTLAFHAAARGIEIEAISSELKGDIDLRGFLGLSNDVPRGYKKIEVLMKVKSKAQRKTLRELTEFSPVYNTINGKTPVDVTIETY